MTFKHIDDLLEKSPVLPGGHKKTFYSVHCCWWTTFPEDLGSTVRETIKVGPDPDHMRDIDFSLPCCPHCGSVLFEAPLQDFVADAKQDLAHYGEFGLDALIEAHSRMSKACDRGQGWLFYNLRIRRRFDPRNPTTYA